MQRSGEDTVLGAQILRGRVLHGGDINDVQQLWLEDGRTVVRKRRRPGSGAGPDVFEAEAAGLRWLEEAGALPVPQVLAVDEGSLILEYLEPGRPVADFEERLGRGLAALHRASPGRWGFARPNYVGPLPQSGDRSEDDSAWAQFYAQHRLTPMAELAERRASGGWPRRVEALRERLPDLLGPPEPPARLHGDLWGGNLHRTAKGLPALIDPAAYGGHREVDLAMMHLFGGFSPRVFAAYEEVWPLAPQSRERQPLHQLYPLLVHVALFGGGYAAQVHAVLRRYGA